MKLMRDHGSITVVTPSSNHSTSRSLRSRGLRPKTMMSVGLGNSSTSILTGSLLEICTSSVIIVCLSKLSGIQLLEIDVCDQFAKSNLISVAHHTWLV